MDPVNRDAFFMQLVLAGAASVQAPLDVITTVRSGADLDLAARVQPFFRTIKAVPVGAVPAIARFRMAMEYRGGFARAATSLTPSTSVLYSSEVPMPGLEVAGLRRLRRRARKLTRLVHNVVGTSLREQTDVVDDWIFLSEYTRGQALDRIGMDTARTFVVTHPHFRLVLDGIVPDPTLAAQLLRWTGNRRLIVFISRPSEAHGIDRLYRALRVARERGLPLCAAVIGRTDGGWTRQADGRARSEIGLGSDMIWSQLGAYSYAHLLALLSQADAVVAPYRRMSQSGAIALAVGEGVPVFASRAGANPELVREGIDGLLFDTDDEAGLIEALSAVYSDGGRARDRFGGERLGDHLDPLASITRLLGRLDD